MLNLASTPEQSRRHHLLIRDYCLHSYLYYEMNSPQIADSEYDAICQELLSELPFITHVNKDRYLDKDMLRAGSGYHIPKVLAGITRLYVERYIEEHGITKG